MMLLALVLVLGLAVFIALRGDAPTRIVGWAVERLPEDRSEWGQAMAAELTQVQGDLRRWRFAAGVARVGLFPPPHHSRRVIVTGIAGIALTAAVTGAAARSVPGLAVFVGVLSVVLCGYASLAVARGPHRRRRASGVVLAVAGIAGSAAVVAFLVVLSRRHPAATTDDTHVYAIVFAIVLALYIVLALRRPATVQEADGWWAVGGAAAGALIWATAALSMPQSVGGVIALLSPVAAALVLVVAVGAAASTHDFAAGLRAGLATVAATAPVHVAADLGGLLRVRDFVLTDPYDIAAFSHSGYPDAASFLLSDAIAGEFITGMIIYPLLLVAVAYLGAALGRNLRRTPFTA